MELENRETLRILVIDASSSEAEALLNVYRDAGYPTRAQHIMSMADLDEALSSDQKWDLILFSNTELPEGVFIQDMLEKVEQQGRDIPSIALSEHPEDDMSELLKQGIRSVVPSDNDELLLLTSDREVSDLHTRRNYRRMSVALNESEKQRRNLLNDQIDAIIYVAGGKIRYSNPAFNEMVGFDASDNLAGKPFADLIAQNDRKDVSEFLISIEDSGQALAAIQCPLVRKGDSEVPVRVIVSPTSFEGSYTLSLLVRVHDEHTESVAEKQEIEAVRPDTETHLFDKKQFSDQLDVAAQRVVSGRDKFALLCITLDSLRELHAKSGKRVSQPVYKEVSRRMGLSLLEHKAGSWSGDCFMALVQTGDEKAVQELSGQILHDVAAEAIEIEDQEISIQLSIGAVMINDACSDIQTLLVRAKHTAVVSQKKGGGCLSFYKKRRISAVSSVEKHLAGMVSQALQKDNFKLFYQPIVSLKGSTEKHFDVQLRMRDVRGREHESTRFRSKLDKNAMWSKVDRWQVIQAGKELLDGMKKKDNVRLFFHLGGNAFTEKEFLPWMSVAFKAAGIPTSAVVIEMSEQNIVRFHKQAPQFFDAVKGMGFHTGVSEFGCSLKPLDTIEPFNLDYVKLDPSFTKDLTNENEGKELKDMIRVLADKGQKVIVPEVMSAVEMAPLWHTGVDFIQGDFVQEPSSDLDLSFEGDF
ncbi:hypothetical protein EOPP23_11985 [Endozoicomonas sp. OPT23]|uniref:EAL domain-containing response regulator n=1 Tax=Endozoicomonas sp. OPT23 TaxID=2072845 RepID=UPI00129B6774|nr:EAL domain-containing protein [Endozoicomonas sp. OPT23]MRI33706.1 hypothetical protein [Endozoicomonas sp. OPT23]